jgi:hypothetical protein
MRRRVRWNNVGRAAGAALIVGLVVAWPRLAPPVPSLPGPQAAPLAGDDDPRAPEPPAVEPAAGRRDRARERNESAGGRPAVRRRRARERPAAAGRRAARRDDRVARRDDRVATGHERRGGGDGAAGGGEGAAGGDEWPSDGGDDESVAGDDGVAGDGKAPDPAQTEFGFENR